MPIKWGGIFGAALNTVVVLDLKGFICGSIYHSFTNADISTCFVISPVYVIDIMQILALLSLLADQSVWEGFCWTFQSVSMVIMVNFSFILDP